MKNYSNLKITVIRWLITQGCLRTKFLRNFRSISVYTEVSCDMQDDRILAELIFDCETQCAVKFVQFKSDSWQCLTLVLKVFFCVAA